MKTLLLTITLLLPVSHDCGGWREVESVKRERIEHTNH